LRHIPKEENRHTEKTPAEDKRWNADAGYCNDFRNDGAKAIQYGGRTGVYHTLVFSSHSVLPLKKLGKNKIKFNLIFANSALGRDHLTIIVIQS
jgi:hypothetical protein